MLMMRSTVAFLFRFDLENSTPFQFYVEKQSSMLPTNTYIRVSNMWREQKRIGDKPIDG